MKSRNAPIADAFGSDIGVKLMRLDSEIILDCLKTCASEAIPVLAVHDELLLQRAMQIAHRNHGREL